MCRFEFPLANPDVINDGKCRICKFRIKNKVPSCENDVKELQNHYTKHHNVKLHDFENPNFANISQDYDSSDAQNNRKKKPIIVGVFWSGVLSSAGVSPG